MSSLAKKLLIIAAVDGLILQPQHVGQRNISTTNPPAVLIEYRSRRINSLSSSQHQNSVSLESQGIIGLLSLSSYSFLISITKRQQVAQILGKPIFVITGVTIIPLSSQEEASKAIIQTLQSSKQESVHGDSAVSSDSDSDSSESERLDDLNEVESSSPVHPVPLKEDHRNNPAENVLNGKVQYRRFAPWWFLNNGWATYNRLTQGVADPNARGYIWGCANEVNPVDDMELDGLTSSGRRCTPPNEEFAEDTAANEFLPKLLRYTKMMFSSHSFYFSYDYDITRPFTNQDPAMSPLPLYRRVDPLFFWNRHLLKPFIENGHSQFILPLIQGFVGQHEFTVSKPIQPVKEALRITEEKMQKDQQPKATEIDYVQGPKSSESSFLLTLISRRSVKRPGVRYLRRGVDDEGNVANTVETEQILATAGWPSSKKVYSLLQVRGSIPLYFYQSPYYFKPLPILQHSEDINRVSFNRHFHSLSRRYGRIQAVSLIDKHGIEVGIGETYDQFVRNYNEQDTLCGSPIAFKWFDFHSECRGMKFENVSHLVDSIKETLDDFGCKIVNDKHVERTQSGIVRTNCMDCLDRTGVAQCAIGQYALGQQLANEGFTMNLQSGESTQWFNVLWADNGDAISKQYSSTAALKGDYTRTRKRNVRGALNDFGLTLSRYYNNLVNDYFSQACIDYLLGNVNVRVFDEFEANLTSPDPGISLERIRQNAIDTSCNIVISDESEELIGGWTMTSPREPNTLRSLPFGQVVLLLTNAAIYSCRFDWDIDKVASFERIDLRSITQISYGTYITSTMTRAQVDPKQNVGILIFYEPHEENSKKINTSSMQSHIDEQFNDTAALGSQKTSSSSESGKDGSNFIALKILSHSNSMVKDDSSVIPICEKSSARAICEDIERAIMTTIMSSTGSLHVERPSIIHETDIMSLIDAKTHTSFLEHLMFDIKKLVWAY